MAAAEEVATEKAEVADSIMETVLNVNYVASTVTQPRTATINSIHIIKNLSLHHQVLKHILLLWSRNIQVTHRG